MEQHFTITKGHGCGEDVVVVDGAPGAVADTLKSDAGGGLEDLVRRLCDRNGPVGGQGVVFLDQRPAEPEVWWFDRDGRPGPADGHGLRVTGRVVLDRRGADEVVLTSGLDRCAVRRLPGHADGVTRVAVDLPAVRSASTAGPAVQILPAFHPHRPVGLLSAPTPQLVCVVGGYDEDELVAAGRRAAPDGPAVASGADVSFLMPLSAADEVFVRTYAQGEGLTRAHAAGMAACRVVYSQLGAVEPDASVLLRCVGGPARAAVRVAGKQWAVSLEGNATLMFSAELDPAALVPGGPVLLDVLPHVEEIMAFAALSEANRQALEAAGVRTGSS